MLVIVSETSSWSLEAVTKEVSSVSNNLTCKLLSGLVDCWSEFLINFTIEIVQLSNTFVRTTGQCKLSNCPDRIPSLVPIFYYETCTPNGIKLQSGKAALEETVGAGGNF